ncbi:biotin/lipoyl-containing protein [Sinobaca sp. H24]|uniref:biotin/lipoyl-containing protein n=1 Tax=Sinobaca sp. H24 TaxID=2923376 RepID=UPI0027E2F7FD|nr:biotin/lipoyl-containing protein [Sinobaca sp. H24]
MAKEIFMPKLSSTMETGTLLQWFKEEGDPIEVGDPVFEIMTDKINIEVEAYEEGILLKRYYGVDEEVPVNGIVGYIGEKGEEVPEHPGGTPEEPVSELEKETESAVEKRLQQKRIRPPMGRYGLRRLHEKKRKRRERRFTPSREADQTDEFIKKT